MKKKSLILEYAIVMLMEDMLVPPRLLLRFYRLVSTGLICLEILGSLPLLVVDVRQLETYHKSMRCPLMEFLRWNFLMFGALTAWDPSHLLMDLNIYLWQLIMCQNGWRKFPPKLVMQRL